MPKPNKFAVPKELRWKIGTLADAAKVDPRTMTDYITGRRRPKSAATREVIERTLRDSGHASFIRTEA